MSPAAPSPAHRTGRTVGLFLPLSSALLVGACESIPTLEFDEPCDGCAPDASTKGDAATGRDAEVGGDADPAADAATGIDAEVGDAHPPADAAKGDASPPLDATTPPDAEPDGGQCGGNLPPLVVCCSGVPCKANGNNTCNCAACDDAKCGIGNVCCQTGANMACAATLSDCK